VTLILNHINREHAIQVSDRCFTWFREDGTIEHTEDEHNKAVVFKDRFVFSYTGLGELPGCGRTDDSNLRGSRCRKPERADRSCQGSGPLWAV